MDDMQEITIPVRRATAEFFSDARNRQAAGYYLDRLANPRAKDPLIELLEKTAAQAQAAGLTAEDIEAELAAYNAERRS